MRFFRRVAFCAFVLWCATGALVSCNSDDDDSGGEDPPTTQDDILEVEGSGATALAVLSNDQDLDNEPLTVTIDESPTVGSASVNSDNTVRLDLPSGFRGFTQFRYKVTNSLGGFSTSTAVVFVDVSAYRVLYAASGSNEPPELYINDLNSSEQISDATSGALRLQSAWHSRFGGLVAYHRADPAQVDSTAQLFFVKTKPIANPVRVNAPSGRRFIVSAPILLSEDDRWLAFPTAPTGSSQANTLYAVDTNSASDPVLVGSSSNVAPNLTVWGGDSSPSLYFVATPTNAGPAIYRASPGSFDAATRLSPFYDADDSHDQILVSPDQTQVLVIGTHNGRSGAFLLDPNDLNNETEITTDMPAGAVLEAAQVDEAFTRLTYLWRLGDTAVNARLSVVPVDDTSDPTTVLEANISSFSELRPDGAAALITRSPNGRGSDGTLYEVSLDNVADDVVVANDVSGGRYDDTSDRVYLFSSTRPPSIVERSDFDRVIDPLVRSNTPPDALIVLPQEERSAAIVEDPTSGLVIVNGAAPGETLRLTDDDLDVGELASTLTPAIIESP
jgi:hypothetical protein